MNYSLILFFISYIITPKYCINCIYLVHDKTYPEYSTCSKFPINDKDDHFLVTGEIQIKNIKYNYCSVARKFDHMCGEKGKFHHTINDILF
jgi:hypothetical protein